MRFVTGLADVGAADANWAGGKAAALSEARALALTGRRVEERYGTPQDIEWALLGDDPARRAEPADRIVLLQTRPETVWAARERAPVATPKPRASDHVLDRFGAAL